MNDSLQQVLDLPYATIGSRELLVNVLRPADISNVSPAIVYVHGGGWSAGQRTDTPNEILASRGFVTLTIEYRFSQDALFPAAIHDVKAAIRWVRANAVDLRIDPDRIGIWGHSAGGHLAALAALTGDQPELEGDVGVTGFSSAVQAAVPLSGPSWFPAENMYGDKAVARLLGAHQTDAPELATLASPAGHVHAGSPPFLIVHGEADSVVPISQSELLDTQLRDVGVESDLVRVSAAGHDLTDLLSRATVERIASFFQRHLRPPS